MIKPIRDFVVIKANNGPKVSPGGIVMTHTVEDKTIKGTVVSVGSGRLMLDGSVVQLEVRVGDTALFNKSAAMEVKDNEETFWVIREDQLICLFTE